jgi:hypothetical protein
MSGDDYPKNAEEWWKLLDDNLDRIENLVKGYHPNGGKFHGKLHEISAAAAEEVRRTIVGQLNPKSVQEVTSFRHLVSGRSRDAVVGILSETWWGMPESHESRGEDAFFILCDLCSEAGRLYGEGEDLPE